MTNVPFFLCANNIAPNCAKTNKEWAITNSCRGAKCTDLTLLSTTEVNILCKYLIMNLLNSSDQIVCYLLTS